MTIFKSILLLIQIRCLEATAQGQQDVLPMIADPDRRDRITLAHLNTLAAIDALKAKRRRLQRGTGIRGLQVTA